MKQVRFVPIEACNLQVREPQEGEQESRTIIGMPIVYGCRSCNLTPWSEDREVYEVLEAGFISPELLQRSDVVLNLNHSNLVTDILGRYRNSERDTLALDMQPKGIACRCSLPRTSNASDALELMRRGDIDGMSFAFNDNPNDKESVTYERTNERSADGKEVWLRHVRKATGFFDVAIVTHPAYGQTSVVTREFADEIMREIDAQIDAHKREQEATDKQPEESEAEAQQKEQEAKEAQEQAERECGGGGGSDDDETKKKEAEEAAAKAEQAKREQEEREAEELERKAREAKAVMRMRLNMLDLETEEIDFYETLV
jgi:HK97 family phage prohead protease